MFAERTNLTGQFLIAMPALADPNFHRTVTLICEHTSEGALGIVVNRPTELTLGEVFVQLDLARGADTPAHAELVLAGGPVQRERGFVLHDEPGQWESTLRVSDKVGVSTSRDILAAMADGSGPGRALVALGYAGWGAGQLERELKENAWLSVSAADDVLFDTPFEHRWERAARLLGVDLGHLSNEAGHA